MTPALPTDFLLTADDLLGPLHQAAMALQTAMDLLTAIAIGEQTIDTDTAEYVGDAFIRTQQTLKAAMARAQALDAEVLVPRPDLTIQDRVELWKARAAREAAARAQDIAEVSR